MPTTLIRSLYNITSAQQGGVITIGNFDGVHIGHQQLLAQVVEKAKALGVPSLVVTFEPHPFEFFSGEGLTIPRITRLREKFLAISDCGVDHVLVIPFNQKIANVSASAFVKDMVYQTLRPYHIIIGDDFRFGHHREGDIALLQRMGESLGFSVSGISTVSVLGARVSSTRVREALAAGDHALTRRLLGHPYSMLGRIRYGDQLGRQWGVPTANIHLHRKLSPVCGIYTVIMEGVADRPWPGVAYVGMRPTINGTRTLLEVHLLDFNQEIYGRYVRVIFCEKLRDDVRFQTVECLKEQIAKDVALARRYFKNQGIPKEGVR